MTSLFKNLLDGARQILRLWPTDGYVIPAKGGFRKDAAALRGDARKITSDLCKTLPRAAELYNIQPGLKAEQHSGRKRH